MRRESGEMKLAVSVRSFFHKYFMNVGVGNLNTIYVAQWILVILWRIIYRLCK